MPKPGEIGSDDIVVQRKGDARGVSPVSGAAPAPEPVKADQAVAQQGRAGGTEPIAREAVAPDPLMTVPMVSTPLRLPAPVSESLRNMAFKTRRSKQDICLEFIRRGLDEYWRSAGEG